jgi:hypothetical protein
VDGNSGCFSNVAGCACLTVRAPSSYRASSGTKAAALTFASARRSSSLPLSHFLFYLPAMTPPSKHAHPPDEDGEEDIERSVRRPRTSAPHVDSVSVDGPVVVLSDQVEERGRRRDSWDRVKRRLRSAFDLLRALFFVQVQDERVCLRLRGFIQPRVRQWSMSWRALWRTSRPARTTLDTALAELKACLPASLDEDLDEPRLDGVLVGLLAFILRGAVDEYHPLFDKLTPERQ